MFPVQNIGWPKSSFGFFCYHWWKNPNEPFSQPNMSLCPVYSNHRSLHFLIPFSHLTLHSTPLPIGNTSLFSVFLCLFLFCYISFFYFLDSTYKWKQIVFVLSCMIHFTKPNTPWVHSCCLKWQNFILFNGWVVFHSEKAMAPHSSTLAWKIPWTEEPRRLSLRVGHDWVTSLSLFTFMLWRRKWQPTPVFLPGESQGQRSLVGCCLWGRTESDTTEAT